MFLDAFFCKFWNIFFLHLPPSPPPLVLGQGSKVRGERSFPPESRGGGWGGRGCIYMSSGVCFWIHFEFPEDA